MKMVREKRNVNERRDVQKFYLLFSYLIGYIKRKSKVKDIFDFGGKLPKCPPFLPTIKTSPIAL